MKTETFRASLVFGRVGAGKTTLVISKIMYRDNKPSKCYIACDVYERKLYTDFCEHYSIPYQFFDSIKALEESAKLMVPKSCVIVDGLTHYEGDEELHVVMHLLSALRGTDANIFITTAADGMGQERGYRCECNEADVFESVRDFYILDHTSETAAFIDERYNTPEPHIAGMTNNRVCRTDHMVVHFDRHDNTLELEPVRTIFGPRM